MLHSSASRLPNRRAGYKNALHSAAALCRKGSAMKDHCVDYTLQVIKLSGHVSQFDSPICICCSHVHTIRTGHGQDRSPTSLIHACYSRHPVDHQEAGNRDLKTFSHTTTCCGSQSRFPLHTTLPNLPRHCCCSLIRSLPTP